MRDAALGWGLAPTWYPKHLPLGIPIDHVLISAGLHVLHREIGAELGSDHRPVVVDLRFEAAPAPPAP